ncbi:hypothetical protein TRICI_005196 [Trichomonascus ciferrii]|uniref:Uncharacterized protein n=1 Tax=Trichomonascus ciferrii TaxID=44093 RepID=A0A642UV12_9ASCO|nr:hypothetical protein TRICI_005196 [Trichomonascus ciferrii]
MEMKTQQETGNVKESIRAIESKRRLLVRVLLDIFCVGLIYTYIYIHGSGTLKGTPGGVEVFAFTVYGIKAHLLLLVHTAQLFDCKNNQNGSIQSQIIDSCNLATTVALSLFFNNL